jgi:hypothetical protein
VGDPLPRIQTQTLWKLSWVILLFWAVSFYATCHPCTRPLGSILHAVAFHGPDIVQPSHHAKIDDLLDGLRARISAIIS